MTIGFLHPGAMGASLAAATTSPSAWASAGRSDASRQRAEAAGLIDAGTLEALVDTSDVIVSVCPPGSAVEVADAVRATGFAGVYADVNAIAPATARAIADKFDHFVDGGIVGPPVSGPGSTRLYLSGTDAPAVAEQWAGTDLEVRVVDGGPGAASAVKTCFATWTKASSAMLLAVRALARAEGVEDALLAEWATSMPDLDQRAQFTAAATAPKAWRFVGEMQEQAAAFEDAGLPGGFSSAAAEVFQRMDVLRDVSSPDLEAVLEQILGTDIP